MRRVWFALLALPVPLSACGHSSPPTATLSVTCGGSLALAGAASIDVASDPSGKGAVMTFPDPANPGSTGTIAVTTGQPCTVAPVLGAGGSGGGDNSGGGGSHGGRGRPGSGGAGGGA